MHPLEVRTMLVNLVIDGGDSIGDVFIIEAGPKVVLPHQCFLILLDVLLVVLLKVLARGDFWWKSCRLECNQHLSKDNFFGLVPPANLGAPFTTMESGKIIWIL